MSGASRPLQKPGNSSSARSAETGLPWRACVLLGKIAIGDWLTTLIAAGSLAVLFRWKVSNPLLVGVCAVIGLIAFPLLQPAWVMVK
jgi:chromate transporter